MTKKKMKYSKLDDSYIPSFCWDRNWSIGDIRSKLSSANDLERYRLIGWIMREGTFEEIWNLVSPSEIKPIFKPVSRWLGKKTDFWRYTFDVWERLGKI